MIIENDMFDLDMLIPTKEELERTIEHITEIRDISFEDLIVLWKLKLIHMIINSKGVRL